MRLVRQIHSSQFQISIMEDQVRDSPGSTRVDRNSELGGIIAIILWTREVTKAQRGGVSWPHPPAGWWQIAPSLGPGRGPHHWGSQQHPRLRLAEAHPFAPG